MKTYFTLKQNEAILEFLEHINASNNSKGSTSTYGDIFFYKDINNNFYSSYTKQGYYAGETYPYIRQEKIKIDANGVKTYLDLVHNERFLKNLFDRLEIIIF